MQLRLIALVAALARHGWATEASNGLVVIHPVPTELPRETTFKVSVSPSNQKHWQTVDTYRATVSQYNITTGSAMMHNISVASFDFMGSVDVKLEYNRARRIQDVKIRPLAQGIQHDVHNRKITFSLSEPSNLVVQVNDNIRDCLNLFTNTIETSVPYKTDPNLIYFGPGFHEVDRGFTNITCGQTVYLAGGAVVKTSFSIQNASDVTIKGRGVVWNSPDKGAVLIESSRNVRVQDLVFLNPGGYTILAGQADGVTVRNIRSFSSVQWGDGMDFFCSQNVLVEGVFMRNSDDCIALYQHRWNYYGDSSNLTIQNSALWADVAPPINIGTHGNTVNPGTMSGVTIKNIDVLYQHEFQQDCQGTLAINAGDENLIENVSVDGYRIEDVGIGQMFNFRVMFNTKYNTSPGRGIRNVTIKDMSYNGTNADTSVMMGYATDRQVQFVTFENLVVRGQKLSDTMQKPSWYLVSDYIPATLGSFVSNITYT